ncbi:GAF and ANTAR domain-containing protein [Kocuria arenosa]|uniref:GAF and ANTAR domain-containing protein n=1 Tax=Kocuria arenosa TaxID=3071446 RepID=UPI0034D74814
MDAVAEHPQNPASGGGASLHGRLAGQLGELARSLQGETDFEATLATIVGAALDLIPGASDASISVVEARRTIRSHAPSSELPAVIDRLQEQYGQGPCLDAVWEQRIVRVPDLAHEPRWPIFAPAAAAAGASSMLCFQLYVEDDNLGALNVYGTDTGVFDAESAEIGLLVAAHAAVAFADAKRISNLLEAVRTRDLIGQAKGILMERFKITDHQAFLILATASSKTNIKLRDVAEHLTTTGALPR